MLYNRKSANSETARSFEKIALDKGLITPEKPSPFKSVAEAHKTARALTPSDNLADNILKLCGGLRARGFEKYAEDIELKFLQYKQADALYGLSLEGGEAILDHAHPQGSHKMENVEGDAVVEDLIERQKKIQQAILKEPTGKLAGKHAVNIARILLAQSKLTTEQLKQTVKGNLQAFRALFRKIKAITDKESMFHLSDSGLDDLVSDPTYTKIQDWMTAVQGHMSQMEPSISGRLTNPFGIGEMSAHIWSIISGAFNSSLSYLRDALEAQGEIDDRQRDQLEKTPDVVIPDAQTSETPAPQASPEAQRLTGLLAKVQTSTKFKDDAQRGQVQSWLSGINQRLQNPQTADRAKKELLDAETALAPYI